MIIYKAINIFNNKIYIGQTKGKLSRRKWKHFQDAFVEKYNSKFHRAIRKYGKENFKWEILCECKTIQELNEKEIFYIKKYNSFSKNGYNLTTGGENFKRSEETRKKYSKIHKGKIISDEHRKKLSIALKGRKFTEEHRNNISISMKGRECTWLKGKKLSEETKRKMSLAQIGNKKGIGNKSRKGKSYTNDEKKRMSESCKGINSKIVCRYDMNGNYIDEWNSIKDFLLHINKDPSSCSHISAVCKGKRLSAYGYKWSYKNKNIL